MRRSSFGQWLIFFGGLYQVLNAVWWGWWIKDWEPNIWARGAIFNGFTLEQVIAKDFGFLVTPLFVVTLVLLIAGIVLLWTDTA